MGLVHRVGALLIGGVLATCSVKPSMMSLTQWSGTDPSAFGRTLQGSAGSASARVYPWALL